MVKMMNIRTVNMKEWDSIILEGCELSNKNAKETARILNNSGIMEIIELKDGILIETNSYIGRIKLDDLQINIMPKIEGLPLYHLVRYAYGFRDIKILGAAEHNIDKFSFFDLLILELYLEARDLFFRGIHKSYISREESLQNPRGRIDINKLCMQGGMVEAKLPCRYFNRDENNILNQILLAGLNLSLNLLIDNEIRIQIERLCGILSESIDNIVLSRSTLQFARNNMNRLTERYSTVLEIINILYESQGIQLEDGSTKVNLQGYFFDMNVFFETLVYRLLIDYCEEYSIIGQYSLYDMFTYTPGYNPQGRESPTQRPDFALVEDGKVIRLLDAKYRDLWKRTLPTYMLYQLAIYAISGMGDNVATILYPSEDDTAVVQKIDIKNPIRNTKIAQIVLQPVDLNKVAMLVSKSDGDRELTSYVNKWIFPNLKKSQGLS